MKYYIIAGEASGDLHASNLIHALKLSDSNAQIRGWGGNKMCNEGADIVVNYSDTAFMGYWSVIKNLSKILKLIDKCKNDILQWNPDAIILVDYPGFNLKIAKFAQQNGFRVFYYIPPKIWAWKEHRIRDIKQFVNKVYAILPFEVDFYRKHNYPIQYVGNPSLDSLEYALDKTQTLLEFTTKYELSGKPIIALLPGSRKQEIKALLPTMSKVAKAFPNYEFVISGAPGVDKNFYESFATFNQRLIFDDTYQLVKHSEAAIVASGTATLETALIGTPQIVVYKANGGILTFIFGKVLFRKIKFISLVNLILKKLCVVELLQQQFNDRRLINELKKIIKGGDERVRILSDYQQLSEILGKPGASARAAEDIFKSIQYINK